MRIEQTLHGYSEGHRLLAASLELPRGMKHMMLTLSDMSGRHMVSGFESYLTGYPIPELDLYAFAQTWYAPEMERSGCVWTHTLLVKVGELESVEYLAVLGRLFRRPTGPECWNLFERPLVETLFPQEHPVDLSTSIDPEIARRTLGALYGLPDRPVFIVAADAQLYEPLVLAIWSQQWRGLRARFTFCTGAISTRSLGRRAFDLQVVPLSSAREILRQTPDGVFVNAVERGKVMEAPDSEWLSLALSNFTGSISRRLRHFFLRIPLSQERGREAFVPLTQLSLCTSSEGDLRFNTVAQLIQAVAERFPAKDDGREIKAAIAGQDPWLGRALVEYVTEQALLRTISTIYPAAYDSQELSIESRSRRLWTDDPEGAKILLSFLIRQNHNIFGEALLSALLDSIGVEAASSLSADIPGLLETIIRRDPSRAAAPTLWTGPYERQRELFDAATSGQVLAAELRWSIVEAMLDGKSDAVADKVFRYFGSDAVAIVLAWYDRRSRQTGAALKRGWIQSLAACPEAVLSWLTSAAELHGDTASLAASLLNPHSSQVRHAGIGVWLRLSVVANLKYDDNRLIIHGFSLALAFEYRVPEATDLIVHCFDTVHDAIEADRLSYDLWESWFNDVLPSLSWSRNWDKCERLRRGLILRIVESEWPATLLSRCTSRPETFERLLVSCWDVKGGKRALKDLRKEVENRRYELTDEFRALVLRFT